MAETFRVDLDTMGAAIFALLQAVVLTQSKLLVRIHKETTGNPPSIDQAIDYMRQAEKSVGLFLESFPDNFRRRFESDTQSMIDIIKGHPERLMN